MRITKLIKGILWQELGFSEGKISYHNSRLNIAPSSLMSSLLENSDDFWKEAMFQYDMAKKAYIESFFKNLKDEGIKSDKLVALTMNFVDLGGWGKVECLSSQIPKGRAVYKVKESALALAYLRKYSTSKYPVCHTLRGAMAAGASAIHGKLDIDAVETKCLAKGDPYCEFLVKPRKEFLKSENEEFKKQLGLK